MQYEHRHIDLYKSTIKRPRVPTTAGSKTLDTLAAELKHGMLSEEPFAQHTNYPYTSYHVIYPTKLKPVVTQTSFSLLGFRS